MSPQVFFDSIYFASGNACSVIEQGNQVSCSSRLPMMESVFLEVSVVKGRAFGNQNASTKRSNCR